MGFGSAYFNFIPGVLWAGLGRTLWILGVFWRDGILKEMPCKRFIRVRPITLYSTRRFIRQEKDFAWLLIGRLSLLPNSPLGRWGLAAEWLWCRGWWCLKNLRVWRMMMVMMYRSGDYPWWKPWSDSDAQADLFLTGEVNTPNAPSPRLLHLSLPSVLFQ